MITYGRRFLSCFLVLKENYIFLWISLLSGANGGDFNIEGMPKSLVSYLTQVIEEWLSLPFFNFSFFPPKISSQPSPITLFFLELLVVI